MLLVCVESDDIPLLYVIINHSHHQGKGWLYTIFLRSDAAATIYFASCFVRLLFEGGIYFFRKPGDINDGWIRYVTSATVMVARHQTLSVVHAASQSCCQPWERLVQHKQS